MKRRRREKEDMGPAAAALSRRSVFRDARASQAQLTAAQLIADAQEMQRGAGPVNDSTRVVINSREELALYRQKTRAELEERVKRGYTFLGNWVKYARWEAQQKDFERMRSILERAVKFHGTDPMLWRDYAELEEEHGFVNHARAVWDRGVTALPAATDLWLKYLVLEQAAGQENRARDVFNRWLSGTTPPTCAWELYALFEAQCQRADACRSAIRRYVEAHGTVETWLFYGATELSVLGNVERAVKVYETAMESLPKSYTNGEIDCRIPLAWADALTVAKKYEEARRVYHRMLQECASVSALDNIFAAYSHFERLYGDNKNCEAVAVLVAKAMYKQRIIRNPYDFDAYVSQYLILRDTVQHSNEDNAKNESASEEALMCLTSAVRTDVYGSKDPTAVQRQAVIVMEYARFMEGRDLTAARGALASCIRNFPFQKAWCPRLWVEAAALEQRHGSYSQARRLLGAALNLSACPEVFTAALRLEEEACAAGELNREDRVQRSRTIFETAIKQFPHDFTLWEGYAKMEEKEEQFHRSDALRAACIQCLSAAARASSSMADRYRMLEKVDQAWAKRLALKRRLLRGIQKVPQDVGSGNDEATKREKNALLQLYRELLDSVWEEYTYEALRWKSKTTATGGILSPPPERMPEVLAPAVARWGDAVGAVANFVLVATQRTGEYEASSVDWMRTVFREMLERERPELLRKLGGFDDNASYEAVQQVKLWGGFLVSPIVTEWRRFEATYATPAALEAVQAFMRPAKRRTRLFVGRRA
ncbi:crooked neck [Trypanosoma rangeli]|uniref:Crooked neck n=1 Tax=Trypanosoma rangeli TaxID=5698 RepID=A0A3R7P515_TRYRA|nr:crooked neck [Trypanosoma rangeli]RNF12848.1 crooked neck [Trypanosoma rangeli]|eukprot:RNF12848.1 crooked neck [Trypanosoma rangeli]